MDIEMVLGFINADLVIIVIGLYCIGLFLKEFKFVPDYLIPVMLLILGIAGGVLYSGFVLGLGFTSATIVVAIIQGVLCASVAVYGHQFFKQLLQKSYEDKMKWK